MLAYPHPYTLSQTPRTHRQGHIIQLDVEARRSPGEVVADQLGNHLSLRNQLAGIELGDNAFENLVDDGRQNALIVVGAEGSIDLGQGVDLGPREDTAGDVNHLQVLGSRQGRHQPRLRSHIVGNGRLEPGDHEVRACRPGLVPPIAQISGCPGRTFGVNLLAHTAQPPVLNRSVSTVDIEKRILEDEGAATEEEQTGEASSETPWIGWASKRAAAAAPGYLLHTIDVFLERIAVRHGL